MNIKNKIVVLMVLLCIGLSAAEGLKNPFKWVFTKVKSCTPVVPLAAKVTAQKASYETKKAFLAVANKLEVLDPRLTGLVLAQETAQAVLATAEQTLRAAQTSLNVAEKTAEGVSKLSRIIGKVAGKAFNIKQASFEGYAKDLKGSPVIKLAFDGIIAGQPISLSNVELNLMIPLESIPTIIGRIVQEL